MHLRCCLVLASRFRVGEPLGRGFGVGGGGCLGVRKGSLVKVLLHLLVVLLQGDQFVDVSVLRELPLVLLLYLHLPHCLLSMFHEVEGICGFLGYLLVWLGFRVYLGEHIAQILVEVHLLQRNKAGRIHLFQLLARFIDVS